MLLCMAVRWSDKFLPLDQRNLTDRIVNHMKDLIASHQLESGQKLPTEHELSKLLRVSRATVREAKKVLEAAGLIQIKPGNGSYVTGSAPQILTISDSLRFDNKQLSVKDFFEGRTIIEAAAAELAAQRSTNADIERIEACFSEMETLKDDLDDFVESDIRFHQAVVAATHNDFLIEMYQNVGDILRKTLRLIVELPMVRTRALTIHRKILGGIRMRNPTKARKASLDHLEDVWSSIKISLQIEE